MGYYAPHIAKDIIYELRRVKSFELQTAIETVIRIKNPSLVSTQIADDAYTLKTKVRHQLNKHLKECETKKINPLFQWSEIDEERIISLCNKENTTKEENDEDRYKYTEDCKLYLQNIDPVLFEKLGKNLLQFIGCEAFVTQASQDEGIDFGGVLRLSKSEKEYSIASRVLQEFSLKIIGQAKRYKNEVGVNELRELNGTLHEKIIENLVLKHKGNEIINKLKEYSYPTALIFITTGRFTSTAINLAKDVGMILMDGDQVAQALLHMEHGCKRNETGIWEFDGDSINDWLVNS